MKLRLAVFGFAVLALLLWGLWRRESTPVGSSGAAPRREAAPAELPRPNAPGPIDALASSPAREPAPQSETAPEAAPEQPAANPNRTGTLVHGHVRHTQEGAEFAASPFATLTDERGRRQFLECSPEGAYAIAGVAPGTHWLTASATGGGWGLVEFEVDSGVEELEVDVPLDRGWQVQVVVRTQNGGTPGWLMPLAVATLEPLGDWWDEPRGAPTSPYGVGRFLGSEAGGAASAPGSIGTLQIEVDEPVWVHVLRHHRVLARQRIQPGQEIVEFVVDAAIEEGRDGSLKARLISAVTGQPIAAAGVDLESQHSQMARTDAEGRLIVRRLAPGLCRVKLRAPGHAWDELLRIEPGVELDLGDLRVPADLSIRGRLIAGGDGETLPRIRCERLVASDGEPLWNGSIHVASAGGDGVFMLRGLVPGTYALSVEGDGLPWRRQSVTLVNRPVDDVELVLEATTPVSILVGRDAIPGERLELLSAAGARLAKLNLRPGPPNSFQLTPGQYYVRFRGVERALDVKQAPILLRLP